MANALGYDLLQNGVLNSGDLALSGLSINSSTCALTLTVAAGTVWVSDANGTLIRVVLPATTTTLSLDILPGSGGWQTNGVFVSPTGALAFNKEQGGGGATGTISATTVLKSGWLKIAEVSTSNAAGVYTFGNGSGTATQGTNWLDRRPWARGAYHQILRNSGTYTRTSSAFALIDSTNLQPRIECSGVPLRCILDCDFASSTGLIAIGLDLFIDGTSFSRARFDTAATANSGQRIPTTWEITPTAGSHLIGPAFSSNNNAATMTIVGNSGEVLTFTIEELIRQNANNGTA